MNTFCPLIKETCKQDECIAWKGQCMIMAFFIVEVEKLSEVDVLKNQISDDFRAALRPEPIPLEIENISHEQLARELVEFIKQEFSFDDDYHTVSSNVSEYFWSTKGIDDKWVQL